uniref:ATP-binding protein n=1 Tax=candidate division WOR-3 bacterium TaxID=2052148 RepID=A0A7C6EEN8_UNCW3
MDANLARAIINKLGGSGTPPEFGIETFTIGLERYSYVIEEEYLKGILKYNLSSFKLITGNYGGGKTHFLYTVRNLGWKHNFVVAYVGLNPTECPFDKLELVYKQIAVNLMPPLEEAELMRSPFQEKGIDCLLHRWYEDCKEKVDQVNSLQEYLKGIKGTESTSFLNAVKGSFASLIAEDEESFDSIVQWLKGEEIGRDIRARYRISERIDKATAFRMIRSLAQWIHMIGYSGLILLFDEAERGMSISSARDKRRALDNLRQIIDECGNSRLPGVMFFYAIPDENLLLEGSGGVYEALKQRLRSAFTETNPVGVKINLEELGIEPAQFLSALGLKLANLFEVAYNFAFNQNVLTKTINNLSDLALSAFAYDVSYRRLFVVGSIEAFHRLRANPNQALTRKDCETILKVTTQRLAEATKAEVEKEEF